MSISQFKNFQQALKARQPKAPSLIPKGGFSSQTNQPSIGEQRAQNIASRVQTGNSIYAQNRSEVTNRLAQDLVSKSAGQVPMDEFGMVANKLTDLTPQFRSELNVGNRIGKLATAGAEAKQRWHQLKQLQDLQAYQFSGQIQINGSIIPGATADNPGARAVALAMKVERNHTPYVWGGNSLSKGVDCSGFVQQIYRQLGISIPRVTYDQAKHGHKVDIHHLRPGDLVFYRNLEHVGLYIGNGKIVHAANSRLGIITSNLYNSNGAPDMAIRPY